MSSKRSCLNNPNTFCYICGEYVVKKFRKPINDFVKKTYFEYFKIQITLLDRPWLPKIVCKLCAEHLRQWASGKRAHMKFSVPMIWSEPKNHFDDCYFCVVKLHGINKEREHLPYFSSENDIVFCNDIGGLLTKMGLPRYQADEWRLFIDSSKRSLKCVLLHIGNKYAAVPIGHSTKLKEEYETIRLVLEKLKYRDHEWVICVDLKMVNFLLGQQSGYTKFPCFLCLWDSRAKHDHWIKKNWPIRENMVVGKQNVIKPPLVSRDNIILPPLHIKLGLMKQYVKALDKTGSCFAFISQKFPGLSMEKLKAGIFDGPQIRQLIKDKDFTNSMNNLESAAWKSFVKVVKHFLGNEKAKNYVELVQDLLNNFKNLGCNMSIKVHYLHSHLEKFPENLGSCSEEQGERFHQDLKVMEDRYQGRWDEHMMADYCWSITRDSQNIEHCKKSRKRSFLPMK